MCMARAVSRVHEWHLCVPPPVEYIYVILHRHILCVCVGRTVSALIQRLRKHFTTAMAHTEDSRFHEQFRCTDLADWLIVPLEIVWSSWEAAVAERSWWDKFRRWVLNDMPPRIPHDGAKMSKLVPQRAVQAIRNLTTARATRDFPRIAALRTEIGSISIELQLPLLIPDVIRVPCMTGEQKLCISKVVNSMMRKVKYTVRRCFEAESNKCEKSIESPVCYCSPQHRSSWERGGPITVRDGHFCLLPVSITYNDNRLGSKDPLQMDGSSCPTDVVTDLEHLARLLNVPMPNISKLLPHSVFHTSRGLLSHVQSVAQDLSQFAITRIVDKSPGTLWVFCRAWVWEQTTEFLHAEKYSISTESRGDLLQGLLDLVQSKGWVTSNKARLALLHLIGKGKSLSLKHIIWRPICAKPAPVVPRWKLRRAARAFTCFLKSLSSHITGSFLHLSIQDVGRQMLDLNTWHCTVIGEADCKDQFNRILPSDLLQSFHEATEWLHSKCRWRAPRCSGHCTNTTNH